MKKLIGLKGGKDGTFFEILDSKETEIVSYPSIKDGKEVEYPFAGTDEEHAEYLANKQQVIYRGYHLNIAGNAIHAESVLQEMGYDAFSSSANSVDIYDNRGGSREGSGRPPTGRKAKQIYVTDDEHAAVKNLIEQLRKPPK